MSTKEQQILRDEMRIWREALQDEKSNGNEKKVKVCEGAIKALNSLALELGVVIE